MKKIYMILAAITLLSMSLNAQMTLTKAPNRANRATTETFDFTTNDWGFPEGSGNKTTDEHDYSNGTYTITLAGGGSGNGHYYNTSDKYLLMGKSGATLTFPAFNKKVKQIQVVGRTNASTSVVQNIYVGSTAVSTATTGATGANTYVIDANYQTIGTIYILKVTSNHNTQITSITITFESENADLTVPESLNVGINTGSGVSKSFNLSGSNLNQSLSLSVNNADFIVSPDNISAADAMAGTTVTVTYNGTSPSASATLTISSSEVSATVPLTANYVDPSTGTTYEKVTSSSQLSATEQYILVCEDKNLALTSTAKGNLLAGEEVAINSSTVLVGSNSSIAQFTLGGSVGAWKLALGSNYLNASSGSTNLKINSTATEWTITNDEGNLNGFRVKHSDASRAVIYQKAGDQFGNYAFSNVDGDTYCYAWLYVKKSTTPTPTAELTSPANGDIIPVGTNTGNGVSKTVNIKGNNLTAPLSVSVSGTGFSIIRENRDPSVTVSAAEANAGQNVIVTYNGTEANAEGTLTVQSSEIGTVTAQLTASYNGGSVTEYETLALFDTTGYVAQVLPVYGYNYDYAQHNQMIYPASLLTDMAGKNIKSMTFYPATYTTGGNTYKGINFYNGSVTFKLMEVNGSTGYTASSPSYITGNMTTVRTEEPTRDQDATTWVIEFDEDYEYGGGDLVVDVTTVAGDWGRTYFYVGTTSSIDVERPGLYQYGSYSAYSVDYVPRVTFTYGASSEPVLTAPQNGDNVALGTYEAPATEARTTITVKGRNLTQPLTVSVNNPDFHVLSTNSISADDANAGTTITVTYDGTDANATAQLTITSSNGEVSSVTVNLTSGYIAHNPELTAPTSGTTINVGTNSGLGANKDITVSGNYLTQPLTVSVTGTGFRVSPTTLTANDVNNGTTITVTYTGTNPNATGTLTISSGEVSVTVNLTASYSTGIAPTVHGMVRMGTLPIVDQFTAEIPSTNDHAYRYTYFLQLAARDTITSSPARVPVQHTGAEIQGYYSTAQMEGDTDPANFLAPKMLTAEVDMNLSPASAPYFYTINSVKNGVPSKADDYTSYLSVLQRREAGDYQEMQNKYNNEIANPYLYKVYSSGDYDFVDYRTVTATNSNDYLSYAPIVWTKGIDRYYYTSDSLHNSYGAPLWKVRSGDVTMDKPQYERQAKIENNQVVWNPYVNWYDENNQACSLFAIKNLHATGVLPLTEGGIEYEPYMFRLWVYCDGLRNYTKNPQNGEAVNDPDADRTSPRLLDTKYCHGADDLSYDIVKDEKDWDNNIYFGALNSISNPRFVVRFYYVVKGHQKSLEGSRAEGDEHVGYVAEGEGTPDDPFTAVHELSPDAVIVDQIFYNVQGMQSSKPFDGINIVVTRYSDGSTTTTKVVR